MAWVPIPEAYNSFMARKVADLFQEASQLPENDRAELAGRLLDSIIGEPDRNVELAWAEEVERRVREIDSGEVATIPWEEVRARLHACLNDHPSISSRRG